MPQSQQATGHAVVTFDADAGIRTMQVAFYDQNGATTFDRATRVELSRGTQRMKGRLRTRAGDKTTFEIEEGMFAGGEFSVQSGATHWIELVTFGSGVPVVARERGVMESVSL